MIDKRVALARNRENAHYSDIHACVAENIKDVEILKTGTSFSTGQLHVVSIDINLDASELTLDFKVVFNYADSTEAPSYEELLHGVFEGLTIRSYPTLSKEGKYGAVIMCDLVKWPHIVPSVMSKYFIVYLGYSLNEDISRNQAILTITKIMKTLYPKVSPTILMDASDLGIIPGSIYNFNTWFEDFVNQPIAISIDPPVEF